MRVIYDNFDLNERGELVLGDDNSLMTEKTFLGSSPRAMLPMPLLHHLLQSSLISQRQELVLQ